jgi:hypothetical protein
VAWIAPGARSSQRTMGKLLRMSARSLPTRNDHNETDSEAFQFCPEAKKR